MDLSKIASPSTRSRPPSRRSRRPRAARATWRCRAARAARPDLLEKFQRAGDEMIAKAADAARPAPVSKADLAFDDKVDEIAKSRGVPRQRGDVRGAPALRRRVRGRLRARAMTAITPEQRRRRRAGEFADAADLDLTAGSPAARRRHRAGEATWRATRSASPAWRRRHRAGEPAEAPPTRASTTESSTPAVAAFRRAAAASAPLALAGGPRPAHLEAGPPSWQVAATTAGSPWRPLLGR